MAIKLTITSEDLLNTKFSTSPRGYNPLEVDQYLDKILRDYRTIESNCLFKKSEIDRLKNQIADLEKERSRLQIEIAKYEKRFEGIKDNKNVNVSNIDLLKRISALEKYIYQTGGNPKTIK